MPDQDPFDSLNQSIPLPQMDMPQMTPAEANYQELLKRQPTRKSPAWWQHVLAGGLGAIQGYTQNARYGPHAMTPVDMSGAVSSVYGYPQQAEAEKQWQAQVAAQKESVEDERKQQTAMMNAELHRDTLKNNQEYRRSMEQFRQNQVQERQDAADQTTAQRAEAGGMQVMPDFRDAQTQELPAPPAAPDGPASLGAPPTALPGEVGGLAPNGDTIAGGPKPFVPPAQQSLPPAPQANSVAGALPDALRLPADVTTQTMAPTPPGTQEVPPAPWALRQGAAAFGTRPGPDGEPVPNVATFQQTKKSIAQDTGKLVPVPPELQNDPYFKGQTETTPGILANVMKLRAPKAETLASRRNHYQDLLAKAQLPMGALDSQQALTAAIQASPHLTPEDRNFITSFEGTNNTPLQTAKAGVDRAGIFASNRLYPAVNLQTGQETFISPQQFNTHPDLYASAAGAAKVSSQQALFSGLHTNIQNVRNAFQNLPVLDDTTRAQLAIALHSTDPRSAVATWLTGEVNKGLTPEQEDVVSTMALLSEDAMSMRTIAGLGQGSDEVRRAIANALPSPKDPSKEFSIKKLNNLEQLVSRLQAGALHAGKLGETDPSTILPTTATPTTEQAPKHYTQANVDAAVQAHPGLSPASAEAAFKAKGWTKVK